MLSPSLSKTMVPSTMELTAFIVEYSVKQAGVRMSLPISLQAECTWPAIDVVKYRVAVFPLHTIAETSERDGVRLNLTVLMTKNFTHLVHYHNSVHD